MRMLYNAPAQQTIYKPAICLGSQLHVMLAITGIWHRNDTCTNCRNYTLSRQSQMGSVTVRHRGQPGITLIAERHSLLFSVLTVRHLCEDDKVQGDSAKAAQDPGGAGAHHSPGVGTYQDPQAVADIGCDGTCKHSQGQALC